MAEPDPRSAFLERAETSPFDGYRAIATKDDWYASGRVGWFGTFRPDMDGQDWTEHATALIRGTGPLTQLTVVDCHV